MRSYEDYIDDLFFELLDCPFDLDDPDVKRVFQKLYEMGWDDGYDLGYTYGAY